MKLRTALNIAGGLLHRLERWKSHRNEQRDDGDHHQQFDERESVLSPHGCSAPVRHIIRYRRQTSILPMRIGRKQEITRSLPCKGNRMGLRLVPGSAHLAVRLGERCIGRPQRVTKEQKMMNQQAGNRHMRLPCRRHHPDQGGSCVNAPTTDGCRCSSPRPFFSCRDGVSKEKPSTCDRPGSINAKVDAPSSDAMMTDELFRACSSAG